MVRNVQIDLSIQEHADQRMLKRAQAEVNCRRVSCFGQSLSCIVHLAA